MVEFTEWARDIIGRSHRAATRFNPEARIRLARVSGVVEAHLVTEPEPSDGSVEVDGVTVLVEEGLEGLVDVEEPHDRLVLRPPGSPPNVRGDH